MLMLFVPFTDESQLVGEGQTAEAFNEQFSGCTFMESYHESLQRMLQAQSVKESTKLGKKRFQKVTMQ